MWDYRLLAIHIIFNVRKTFLRHPKHTEDAFKTS